MATLLRLYTFSPNTTISSTQVNAEFNQIINTLRGANTTDVYIGSTTPPSGGAPKLMVSGGQAYFVLNGSGDTIRIYREGDASANPRVSISNLGYIRMAASQSDINPSAVTMNAEGVIVSYHDTVGNVGSGEDDLWNYTIYARTMGTTSQHFMHVVAGGNTAANANNKTIKFYVQSTQVFTSGAVAFNNKPWIFDAVILSNPGLSQWRVCGEFRCDTTIVRFNTVVSAVDHTVDNEIKWTGQATADDDITQTHFIIEKGYA